MNQTTQSYSQQELQELLSYLTKEEIAEIDHLLKLSNRADPKPFWAPIPGSPQEQAYYSKADELFFGGGAGGGKSYLLLGLSLTAHSRSIIFRREFPQLRELIEKSREIVGDRGKYNGQEHIWRLEGDRTLEFGATQHEWDVQKYQGRAHDLKAFDEVVHFSLMQYKTLSGWARTADPAQRVRIVATGNPPTDSQGQWVKEYWAPWLDPKHPDPAEPGELRWFVQVDGNDVEVRSPEPIIHKGETLTPRSRTFIPARVDDNPYYLTTGYKSVLQSMPEPLRSQLLYGDFNLETDDDPYQVIPTAWVKMAQSRWRERSQPSEKMDSIGCDPARGGRDKTCIACRYRNWVAPVQKHPGKSTPDGKSVAQLVIGARGSSSAYINIDIGAIGSSPYDVLKDHRMPVYGCNGSEKSEASNRSGQLKFVNLRAEWHWKLREMLEPGYGDDLALPDDPEVLADLTAPRWKLTPRGIQVESKEDIIKRLGRSPDVGESIIYACILRSPVAYNIQIEGDRDIDNFLHTL